MSHRLLVRPLAATKTVFPIRPSNRQRIGTAVPVLAIVVIVVTIGIAPPHPCWSADGDVRWRTFEDCPVQVESVVSVPALESGVIQSIAVERNESVRRDMVIAQLDAAVAESEVAVAQAQYADAQLAAADTSDVDHQRLVVAELKDELQKHLAIGDSVSESEIRSRKLAVKKAEIALHHAERALEHARLNATLIRARLEVARLRLSRHTIRTPVAGVVVRIHKRAGEWVETGEPLVEIHDLSHLIVDWIIPVDQFDVARLVGAPVVVQPSRGNPAAPIEGRIVSYDHRVSAQGVVRVHARVVNYQHQDHWVLLPGMTVQLQVGLPPDIEIEADTTGMLPRRSAGRTAAAHATGAPAEAAPGRTNVD